VSIASRLVVCFVALFAATAAPAMAAGTVQVGISGAGSVSATGINCAKAVGGGLTGDCSESYLNVRECIDSPIRPICLPALPNVSFVAATSATGFQFDSWTGECAGQGALCTISIGADARFSAIFKDIADPTVTLTAPGVLLSGNATFTAAANDNAGISRVDFTLGGVTVSDTSGPFAASFDTTALPNGVNRAKAVAVDTSGRTKEHAFDVVVDNPVPVVETPAPVIASEPVVESPAPAVQALTPTALQGAKTGGASAPQIRVSVVFTFKGGTRSHTTLTSLTVKGVPAGSTVSAKGFKKTDAKGDVSLKKLLKKPFKAGSTITITVSKPGMGTAIKTVKILPRKTPTVSTKCQAPGAAKAVAC
jgi:hypothetical protein